MGRSKAQDELYEKISDLYSNSFVNDEVYIGDLVEERGYTLKEMEAELGHKVHKMFVDIVLRDSDRTVAFEYHGEQHYSLVGNMTKTSADLMLNQQLDREKSWILTRVGIPLVAVPFDAYIDDAVIEEMIDAAYDEVSDMRAGLSECPNCNRFFPPEQLPFGICNRCREKEEAQERYEQEEAEQAFRDEYDEMYAPRWKKSEESREERRERLAAEKARRKERYRAYKETPEYKEKKEAEKQRRKAYNKQQREKQKQYRKQQRENENGDF